MTSLNSVDKPYSALNFNTTIEIDDINQLRKRLEQNIGFLNYNKQRIRHQEFTQLMNYHQVSLNILNNMQQIKKVEYNNPHNQNVKNYIYGQYKDKMSSSDKDKVPIYDDHGNIKLYDRKNIPHKEEWETQFDQNLINPPCYMFPPTNCYKRAGK